MKQTIILLYLALVLVCTLLACILFKRGIERDMHQRLGDVAGEGISWRYLDGRGVVPEGQSDESEARVRESLPMAWIKLKEQQGAAALFSSAPAPAVAVDQPVPTSAPEQTPARFSLRMVEGALRMSGRISAESTRVDLPPSLRDAGFKFEKVAIGVDEINTQPSVWAEGLPGFAPEFFTVVNDGQLEFLGDSLQISGTVPSDRVKKGILSAAEALSPELVIADHLLVVAEEIQQVAAPAAASVEPSPSPPVAASIHPVLEMRLQNNTMTVGAVVASNAARDFLLAEAARVQPDLPITDAIEVSDGVFPESWWDGKLPQLLDSMFMQSAGNAWLILDQTGASGASALRGAAAVDQATRQIDSLETAEHPLIISFTNGGEPVVDSTEEADGQTEEQPEKKPSEEDSWEESEETTTAVPAAIPSLLRECVVYFDSGSVEISADQREKVTNLSSAMKAEAFFPALIIGGHADSKGNAEANRKLSIRRAEAVRTLLVEEGVPKETMSVRSYGEEKAVVSQNPEIGGRLSRRVDVQLEEDPG